MNKTCPRNWLAGVVLDVFAEREELHKFLIKLQAGETVYVGDTRYHDKDLFLDNVEEVVDKLRARFVGMQLFDKLGRQ